MSLLILCSLLRLVAPLKIGNLVSPKRSQERVTEPKDAATRLAWDAERVLTALRNKPAFEFTVGELIWLVQLAGHAPWAITPGVETDAARLLEKCKEDACTSVNISEK